MANYLNYFDNNIFGCSYHKMFNLFLLYILHNQATAFFFVNPLKIFDLHILGLKQKINFTVDKEVSPAAKYVFVASMFLFCGSFLDKQTNKPYRH